MEGKSQDSSLQEGVSYTYILRLDYSRISTLYKKLKKKRLRIYLVDSWVKIKYCSLNKMCKYVEQSTLLIQANL